MILPSQKNPFLARTDVWKIYKTLAIFFLFQLNELAILKPALFFSELILAFFCEGGDLFSDF